MRIPKKIIDKIKNKEYNFTRNGKRRNPMKKILFKSGLLYSIILSLVACESMPIATVEGGGTIISEITTYETLLDKTDVMKYFCNNLTEYFHQYSYYRITSEIFHENEKQNNESTSRITKLNSVSFRLDYIGSAGIYSITFSDREFSGSDRISTFNRGTVLGNAIRNKIYDTHGAWFNRMEIALMANGNRTFYRNELDAAVELERWVNSLNR